MESWHTKLECMVDNSGAADIELTPDELRDMIPRFRRLPLREIAILSTGKEDRPLTANEK